MTTSLLSSPPLRSSAVRPLFTVVLAAGLLGSPTALAGEPGFPFPQNVPYATGTIIPSQRPLATLNDEVAAAYVRWKSAYLAEAGTETDGHPRYRVKAGSGASSEPTVSEGQGFGMVVVALMAGEEPDAQTLFDGLWEFFNDHRSEVDPRLMDWHVPADEAPEPGDDDSAFDGDCDVAFALLLAEQQWGNDGRVDYRAEAESVLAGLFGSTVGPESFLPMLGDWVEPDGDTYNQRTTRTSDFMPDHFRAFARVTGNSFWNQVVAKTQDVVDSLQAAYSPATGLLPDFVVPESATDPTPRPASPGFLEGPHDGDYYYNAGRDPWRLGVDALLNANALSRREVRAMAQWFRTSTGGDPAQVKAGYRLDGTLLDDSFTSFFAAPVGVAMMLDSSGQAWLNAVWDLVRDRQEDSYADTVTLLSMLVMTRNYWDPSQPPEPACDLPAAPDGISASVTTAPSETPYTVSWSASPSADSYEVQEAVDAAFANPSTTSTATLSTEFAHLVSADTTFHYRVRAVRDCGETSPWSSSVSVTVTAVASCAAFRALVPGVVARPGLAGTSWKSTLSVANPGSEPATVILLYNYTVGSASASVTLPAGGVVAWDDAVQTLFGVGGISGGAVEVCADHAVVALARTYNDAAGGTYGQYLPAVTAEEMLTHDKTGLLGQLRKSAQFRTNVGFVNPGTTPCDARITLRDSSGEQRGIAVPVTVAAGAWKQLDLFAAAGVTTVELATATVGITTAGGRLWAYASIVDNLSGDPTTIPLVVPGG